MDLNKVLELKEKLEELGCLVVVWTPEELEGVTNINRLERSYH